MTTAQAVYDLRHILDLTQPQFAELLGVGFRTVCRWEKGGKLTPAIFTKLALVATEKKVAQSADYFRAMQETAIIGRVRKLETAGSPRMVSATEFEQWSLALSKAVFGLETIVKSQKDVLAAVAFQVLTDHIVQIDNVRSYLSFYAGEHSEAGTGIGRRKNPRTKRRPDAPQAEVTAP